MLCMLLKTNKITFTLPTFCSPFCEIPNFLRFWSFYSRKHAENLPKGQKNRWIFWKIFFEKIFKKFFQKIKSIHIGLNSLHLIYPAIIRPHSVPTSILAFSPKITQNRFLLTLSHTVSRSLTQSHLRIVSRLNFSKIFLLFLYLS